MSLYQLFPSTIIEEVDQFNISQWSDFDCKSSFPFITVKKPYDATEDNRIYFMGLLDDRPQLIKPCERLINEAVHGTYRRRQAHHMNSIVSAAAASATAAAGSSIISCSTTSTASTESPSVGPPNWSFLDKKLLKKVHFGHKYAQLKPTKSGHFRKGNADMRLGFNWQDLYAVKAHFTFGLRQPQQDECHLISTTSSHLFIYMPKEQSRLKVGYYYSEGVFAQHHKSDFECFTLDPNSTYIISSNVTYMLVTVQPTLFSLIRCTSTLMNELAQTQSSKFSALKVKTPQKYVPATKEKPFSLSNVIYPSVILDVGHTPTNSTTATSIYEPPHEDDWTLGAILPILPRQLENVNNLTSTDTFVQNTGCMNIALPPCASKTLHNNPTTTTTTTTVGIATSSTSPSNPNLFNASMNTTNMSKEQFQFELEKLMVAHLRQK